MDLTTISIACILVISVITFSFLILKHKNMSEYFSQMLSKISSLFKFAYEVKISRLIEFDSVNTDQSCKKTCIDKSSSRKRPRLTYVDEDDLLNHLGASRQMTSSSSNAPRIKYDVFISFRGSDIRRGFLSHLLKALSQKQIEAYVDYELRKGDELSQTLYKAIQESQIALVIFSEDYASSKWCLEELVKITECMQNGQIVIPIFYNVDPSDVRHQKGCYKNAFARHEKSNTMNVEKWRTALNEVANLAGFHSTNFGTEDKLIEEIVQNLLARLNHIHQMDLEGGLVGINKQMADLESLIICNGSEDVRAIGIWGMGGIGKTNCNKPNIIQT